MFFRNAIKSTDCSKPYGQSRVFHLTCDLFTRGFFFLSNEQFFVKFIVKTMCLVKLKIILILFICLFIYDMILNKQTF